MPLPPEMRKKYLARFDQLVAEGEAFLTKTATHGLLHDGRTAGWKANFASLLSQVLPPKSCHRWLVAEMMTQTITVDWFRRHVTILRALRDDFAGDFLGDLGSQIEAEVASDYMGQAERLLTEGQAGRYDHVPAAVLAGAVLEKAFRTLCGKQASPIATTDGKGRPLMMNGLIDALKKGGAFNEARAKQLRAWAAVRNHAAHGEFDEFSRSDVEQMVQGVSAFLASRLN